MRIFSSELGHNYTTYTFGYANYGELEAGDQLSLAYNAGFLPYTGTAVPNLLYMPHYWYSFYDLALAKQSLGLWLMLDAVRDAQERGLTHYYLGTVYGEKALYKTNSEPLEWWDGKQWQSDVALLKERGRSDAGR